MPNNLETLIPIMAINILDVARENAVMSRAVTNNYATTVAAKGDTVQLNVMNEHETRAITPSPNIPSANNDIDPANTDLVLDQWYGSSFELTEKEVNEIVEDSQSKALESSTRAVVNHIDRSLLGLYQYVYNFTGVAGTTPFAADTVAAKESNRFLSTGLAPKDRSRNMVLDEFAYYNATDLPKFTSANEMGTDVTIREAMVPYTLGFNWWEDQNVPTHTVSATGAYAVDAAATAGATTIVIDNGAGALAAAMAPGDLFTIAGNTQVYSVISYAAATTEATIGISPRLVADVADGDAITIAVAADHVANLAFHPQAFHLAVRPTGQVPIGQQGRLIYPAQTISDPQTGLNFTLKFFEGYHQTMVEVSALWGRACPRPEFAVRILG